MNKKKEPVFSVIIPSYNHAKYVAKTLESVFYQDISRDLYEVIVIDDGSTDGSAELLQDLKLLYPFSLIIQKNKGVSAALNHGVICSTGQYIALLASDDLWESDKLRLQWHELQKNVSSRFCFTNGSVFGGRSRRKYKPFVFSGNVRNIVPVINFVPSSSVLFHRSLFDEIGGFSEGVALEDWDFLIRASRVTDFTCVNRPLVRYRVHDASTMRRLRADNSMLNKKIDVLHKNRDLINRPVYWSSMMLHHSYEYLRRFINAFR